MDANESGSWLSRINPAEAYLMSLSMLFVAAGRALHWSERKKRLPTWGEAATECCMVIVLGAMTGAAVTALNVESQLVTGGVSAGAGWYGVKAIDWMIKAIAKRLGLEPCQIEIKDQDK